MLESQRRVVLVVGRKRGNVQVALNQFVRRSALRRVVLVVVRQRRWLVNSLRTVPISGFSVLAGALGFHEICDHVDDRWVGERGDVTE